MARRAAYFQEWHILRDQTTPEVAQEWVIDVPRPIQPSRPGLYWALEIHQIEYKVSPSIVVPVALANSQVIDVCLTTAPRTDKTPFITTPADPDNIWYLHRISHTPTVALWAGPQHLDQTRRQNLARYTDDKGFGKLLVGDHLYMQVNSASCVQAVQISLAIEFTWTQVGCTQLLTVYQGRLNES